jgi:hypothetical protein
MRRWARRRWRFAKTTPKDLTRSVWNAYSKRSAWDLVATTRAKGSPWDKVANSVANRLVASEYERYGDYYDLAIPVELIKSYFKSFLAKDNLHE